ncbi:hypothetical protein EIN_044090 [Entamoeba invadens IP1]|uniref:Uncharacterized protein n=1 Tax=Entamoeba invadens IP1 TaxID=370355 RepID=A0A0A1U546_ENTIV|nr:hypothetical protein EIN_044090 [Entamoeba invadens IP1]ELP86861.1 hypothetical protein EIN_044090 [Entamoeba invadens IP1]|eukprot:XP_004253632.1 hypothetical protein EIN_044090 [Entamoeba invadens IP1]
MYSFLNIPPNYPPHNCTNYRQVDRFTQPYTHTTIDKVPFPKDKNYRPPQISLSTQTIFRYRNFTMTLTMSEDWRRSHGILPEDVIKCALAATCHKESVIETHQSDEVKLCKVCQSERRIIEIDHSDQSQIGPVTTADGLEKYTFNKCKSFCSSSRNHHHSRLCIVISGLPDGPFYSAPFVLQAREKRTTKTEGQQDEKDDKEGLSPTPEEDMPFIKEEELMKVEEVIQDEVDVQHELAVVVVVHFNTNDFKTKIGKGLCERMEKIEGIQCVRMREGGLVVFVVVFGVEGKVDRLSEKVRECAEKYFKNDGVENGWQANLLEIGVVSKYIITDNRG